MRDNLNDLSAFAAVAQAKSFTRAAAHLGISQSALSQTIKGLEGQLGVRLLTRTTRSVATTEAGERLLSSIVPCLEEMDAALKAAGEMGDKPSGTIRLTCTEHAADSVLWPRMGDFLHQYPEVRLELMLDYGLSDIAESRFDVGVRLGESVAKDMVAVRIGPDMRFCVVAAPSYLAHHLAPEKPQELAQHNCINLYLPSYGGFYAWEFQEGDREIKVRVGGQLVFNGSNQILTAVVRGFGLAYLPEDVVAPYVSKGELVPILQSWCPSFSGYHLYYPSRRHSSRAMTLLVNALKYSL